MAQYDVVVKAVDKTQGTFKGIESGLKNIESVAKNVQNILAGLITAQAVKSFINAGQELETIQRRLAALSPAGTDVSALFNSLATLSNRLGTGTTDLANAYLILRNNGIQPSVESLTTLNNIAKVSGGSIASIADAIGNVADGERLKALENATNGLIKIDDVLNQYGASTGQFAVKYQGQTVAIVKSTQEALNAINQIGAVNLNKPASETDTLTQSWNRFTNQLGLAAKTLLEGGLEAGLIRVVNKATELLLKIQPLLPALGQDLKSALETAAGALDLISRNIGIVISALDILFKLLIANAVITFVSGIINAAAALRVLAAGAAAAGIAATSASVGFASLATTIAATVRALGPARVALTAIAIALAGWEIYKGVVDKSTDSTDAQAEALKGVNAELERQRKIQEDLAKGLPGLPATGSLQAPASKPLAPSVLNALQQLQKQAFEAEQAIRVLEPALMKALSTGNLNEYNRIFNALKSNYELLGRNVLPAFEVAAKNAFNELNKSVGEDAQRLGVLEANLGRVSATFGAGSPIVQQYKDQIDELRKKFDPLAPSIKTVEDRQLAYINGIKEENRQLSLTTESLGFLKQALDQNLISYDRYIEKLGAVDSRLLTVTQRQALFDGALKKEKDALDLQAESLTFLAAALERGAIGYDRYIEKLGQIDSKLLSATQKQELFNAAISKGLTDSAVQAEQAGQALAEAYATGDLERFLVIYEQYKNVLGATATGELAAATKASNTELDLLNKKKLALEQLIDNYKKAGGEGTAAFRKTAEALGANATQIDLVVAQYGAFADQVKERNDAIKKSIFDASGTFVDEFTKAFIAGKNILDSFKNFFVNILNSIAAELIKQQIAKPIAALLGNFIGELIPGLATGGIARGNQAYIVGEQGPELFVPGKTGRVVPNDTLSSTMSAQDDMAGGALNVNFTINAVDTQTGVQFLLQNKPVITSMISDAYNRRGRRGPLD